MAGPPLVYRFGVVVASPSHVGNGILGQGLADYLPAMNLDFISYRVIYKDLPPPRSRVFSGATE